MDVAGSDKRTSLHYCGKSLTVLTHAVIGVKLGSSSLLLRQNKLERMPLIFEEVYHLEVWKVLHSGRLQMLDKLEKKIAREKTL